MTENKLVCIRNISDPVFGYYRTTRRVAANIMKSDHTSDDWCYTTKGAWKRNDGKRIPDPVLSGV